MRRFVLPLIVLVALCWWFGLEPLANALAHASPAGLLLYAVLTALVSLGYALRWRFVARAVGADAPLVRLLTGRLAGDAVGTLVPSAKLAGDPVRVAIARGADASTAQCAAGVAIDRLLEVTGNLVAVIAYAAIFAASRSAEDGGSTPTAVAALMACLLIGLAALFIRLRRGGRPFAPLYGPRARAMAPRFGAWMDGVRAMEDHLIDFFRQHPRAFVIGVLSSLSIEALIVAQYHALLAAFGVVLELPTLVLVLLGSGVARAVPAPAGLGALEAAQVAIMGAAAGRPDLGFVVGAIVRLHETVLLAIGLLALSYEGQSVTRLRAARQRAEAL